MLTYTLDPERAFSIKHRTVRGYTRYIVHMMGAVGQRRPRPMRNDAAVSGEAVLVAGGGERAVHAQPEDIEVRVGAMQSAHILLDGH